MREYDREVNKNINWIRHCYNEGFSDSLSLFREWWETYKKISKIIQKDESDDFSELLYLTEAFLDIGMEDFGEENEDVKKLRVVLKNKPELVREKLKLLIKM